MLGGYDTLEAPERESSGASERKKFVGNRQERSGMIYPTGTVRYTHIQPLASGPMFPELEHKAGLERGPSLLEREAGLGS